MLVLILLWFFLWKTCSRTDTGLDPFLHTRLTDVVSIHWQFFKSFTLVRTSLWDLVGTISVILSHLYSNDLSTVRMSFSSIFYSSSVHDSSVFLPYLSPSVDTFIPKWGKTGFVPNKKPDSGTSQTYMPHHTTCHTYLWLLWNTLFLVLFLTVVMTQYLYPHCRDVCW
jgi:hypothetical protein